MSSRTPSPVPRDGRGRSPSRSPRSPTPLSRRSRTPSIDRGSRGRSPLRNGRFRSRSPSRRTHSRGDSHDRSYSRSRSASRSVSPSRPLPRSTKIVVERLTKNVNEDHLREIFGQYGEIEDLDLPVNRQSGINRGTAYILFVHEADAEAAIANMHEAHLDGAAINVSIVLPRRKLSPAPPAARRGGFDPRNPPTHRPGPPGPPYGGGFGAPGGRGPPAGSRYGPRSDTYRPRSVSRSRSPAPAGGAARKYRSRSRSYSSRSRSPSRGSYDSYDRRSRSRSNRRDWERR